MAVMKDDFVGRHLIVDASTFTRRNLTSIDTVFSLFEALNRNLDMTAVLPPIVCRYPFANDEIAAFCDDIEAELAAKAKEVTAAARAPVDLSLTPVRVMREFLRRRQMEESGVTGVSIWAESHAAIHTWDEDNYYAFDAFSCRDFRPRDALRLLLTHFDIETLNCVNLFRFQRSIPRVSNFQVNANWEVVVDGSVVGDLDSVSFGDICPGGPAPEDRGIAEDVRVVPAAASVAPQPATDKPAGRDGARGKQASVRAATRPKRRRAPRRT
jgi:S-adenosylmethionine decarboxylase